MKKISSNLGKITTNKNYIDKINENLSNIDFNSNNKFSIENFFIYNIEIERNYILNKDNPKFTIFNYNLEDDFKRIQYWKLIVNYYMTIQLIIISEH